MPDSPRSAQDIYEEALQKIVENVRQQPVPMDPAAFNYARWATDALEEAGWLEEAEDD